MKKVSLVVMLILIMLGGYAYAKPGRFVVMLNNVYWEYNSDDDYYYLSADGSFLNGNTGVPYTTLTVKWINVANPNDYGSATATQDTKTNLWTLDWTQTGMVEGGEYQVYAIGQQFAIPPYSEQSDSLYVYPD